MTRSITVLLILTITLFSCGETGLLLPSLMDDGDVTVQTVADGTVLAPDASIAIALLVGPQGRDPDRVVVMLTDRNGLVALSRAVTAAEFDRGRLPSIPVSGLDPGIYTLDIEFFAAGRQLGAQQRTVFVASGPFRIAGVSAYPAAFEPDSLGILRADLEIDNAADPYLRWSFAGSPVSEGLLSTGAGQLLLRSPATEGVYPVRLELFPTAPRGSGFRFVSTVAQKSDLVVKESRSGAERGFGPASSYYVLMHLAGNLRDAGMRRSLIPAPVSDARLIGDPDLRIEQGLFGYHFDGESGIVFDELLLPVRGGRIDPFSVVMRLVLTAEGSGRSLFSTASEDGSVSLSISLMDDGILRSEISSAGRTARVETDTPVAFPNQLIDISLAVVPGGSRTEVRWFAAGNRVGGATIDLPIAPPRPADPWMRLPGTTRIAGGGGFIGLIDEFGIFFRNEDEEPSADIAVFRNAGIRRFGGDLIIAEGFEAGMGGELTPGEGQVDGGDGVLRIGPASRVHLPMLDLQDGPAIIELAADRGDEPFRVALLEARTVPEAPAHFSILFDGTVLIPGRPSRRIDAAQPLRVSLQYQDSVIRISSGDGTVIPVPLESELPHLYLTIANGSETTVVELDSILVYRDRGQIGQALSIP